MQELLHQYLTQGPAGLFIFAITVVTSLLAFRDERLRDRFILHPYTVIHYKEYYRIITSALIHRDSVHLLFNMLTYFFFAIELEKQVGSLKFVIIYLVSLVAGDISTLIKHKDNPSYYGLGASGAISGLLFGTILYVIHYPGAKILLFFILPIPVWLFPIIFVIFSIYAARKLNDNVAHEVHLYGALAGLVTTLILDPEAGVRLIKWIEYKLS